MLKTRYTREDAEHDDGQEQEAVGDEHPVFLLVEPQREADEREHKEGQRGVHPQIDGRRDAGDAQGVPSDGEQGIEVAARDALTDLEEHQQRARHHREVDREREPLAEHLGEEGADRVHERVIERRMRRVDDLVLHHLPVVEAVLGIDREVLVHILGGVPAADVELLGGVREVIGEQLVLVIALLGEQEQRAHAETEQDDHREYHPPPRLSRMITASITRVVVLLSFIVIVLCMVKCYNMYIYVYYTIKAAQLTIDF